MTTPLTEGQPNTFRGTGKNTLARLRLQRPFKLILHLKTSSSPR